ncbi:hypothetical protein B0H13DRAFT_2350243 [Mycena leptocephala]|nr:hypothetical protein B0H13DRAFT_2350243 [Mycena leptocephala]
MLIPTSLALLPSPCPAKVSFLVSTALVPSFALTLYPHLGSLHLRGNAQRYHPAFPRATLPTSLSLHMKSRSRRDESTVSVTLVSRVIAQLFLVCAPLVSSSVPTPYPGLGSSHLRRECAQH